MKKATAGLPVLSALIIWSLISSSALAQHGHTIDKQVTFASGQSSVLLRGRIPNRLETHTYHLKATQGQTLKVRLAFRTTVKNSTITFEVLDPEGNQIGSAGDEDWSWEGGLSASGEYKILVYIDRGSGNYSMHVEIH